MVDDNLQVYGSSEDIFIGYSFNNFKRFDKKLANQVLKLAKKRLNMINNGKYVVIKLRSTGSITFLDRKTYNGSNS